MAKILLKSGTPTQTAGDFSSAYLPPETSSQVLAETSRQSSMMKRFTAPVPTLLTGEIDHEIRAKTSASC
ncbi:hypothetical protein [Photobacterium arenosum]|uniref:hypothetical protein n=1 Tax=Photobacterium arenosum TaxID=2774143 RepID=UPI00288B66E4|nr:hypothetical protein [Photobacterium arenosum]